MSKKDLLLLTALCVGVISTQGCRTFKQHTTEALVKPLGQLPGGSTENQSFDELEVCLETARSVAEQGHHSEAIKLYERAETLGEKGQSLDAELAGLYAKQGLSQKAVARYRKIVSDGKGSAEIFNNLAWTFYDAGQLQEADRVFLEGLQIFQSDERLKSGSALLAYRLGEREVAIERFASLYGTAVAHHNVALLDLEYGETNDAMQLLSLAVQMENCPDETRELHRAIEMELQKSDR